MKSSFFEFQIATSGLFTAKAGLQVVSHNIANASTTGYSRQVANQRASAPLATWNSKGMLGSGSEVYSVTQIRSLYLDKKYWNERNVLGQYTTKNQQLSLTETIFNELSGTGLSSSFDEFFKTLQDLTTSSQDSTYRNNVLKTSESLVTFVNSTASSLRKQQQDINTEVATVVSRINSLGVQISNLNEKISKYEIDGSNANDLRDQRALLIDELSQYVNINVTESNIVNATSGVVDSRLTIQINGYEFVNHWDMTQLECVPREAGDENNELDAVGLYDLQFTNGAKFNIYSSTLSGQLKGLIDVRDGNSTATQNYKGIPYYIEKLNSLVRTFAKALNEGLDYNGNPIEGVTGHVDGYGKNGDTKSGLWLFTYTDNMGNEKDYGIGDYSKMNCFNFQVNSKLMEEPDLLACASDPYNTTGESDNNVILGFASLATFQSLFKEGKLSDYVTSMTSELGVDTKQAVNFEKNYTDITTTIDNQRIQVSGVSMNEEVLSMLSYQQLYQTAARLVGVINEVYDTMINLGL